MGWRIVGLVSAALAGLATRRALRLGWRTTTGREPPSNPASPGTQWPEAVAWAGVSGAVVGLARMFAVRRAALYYQRSTGHLPKGMERVT